MTLFNTTLSQQNNQMPKILSQNGLATILPSIFGRDILFSIVFALVSFIQCTAASTSETRTRVVVELMIAIDASQSIDGEELRSQIQSTAQAFRDARLIGRIAGLGDRGIAVAVMLWAGENEQRVIVPWQRINSEQTALAFADELSRQGPPPWQRNLFTAHGDALAFAFQQIESNLYDGDRRVIDLSSDDPHNQGRSLPIVRSQIVNDGVTINGLAILSGRDEHEERRQLIDYFRNQVIGGFGAFYVPALSNADYARAMLKKLILEIAGPASIENRSLRQTKRFELYPATRKLGKRYAVVAAPIQPHDFAAVKHVVGSIELQQSMHHIKAPYTDRRIEPHRD